MLRVILNEIRSNLRSGSTMFLALLFPAVMTFFLGTMLEDIEAADDPVGDLKLAYCIEEEDDFARAFEQFILSLDEDKTLSAVEVTSDELDIFSEGYSAAARYQKGQITIYPGKNSVQNRTVKALMDGYNQTAGAYAAVAETDPAVLGRIEIPSDDLVIPKDFGRTRTMMDYYAVAMTVVMIFFSTVISAAESYGAEYKEKTIVRLDCSPVGKTKIYFAKIIGRLPLSLLQISVGMIVSVLCFGAKFCVTFGENMLLFLMFFCVALAGTALGVLFDLLLPRLNPYAVFMPVMWTMLFFSGAFSKDINIPGVSEYLPPKLILNAAFELTSFSRAGQAVSVIFWSLGVFAALVFAGWLKVRAGRKRV